MRTTRTGAIVFGARHQRPERILLTDSINIAFVPRDRLQRKDTDRIEPRFTVTLGQFTTLHEHVESLFTDVIAATL